MNDSMMRLVVAGAVILVFFWILKLLGIELL